MRVAWPERARLACCSDFATALDSAPCDDQPSVRAWFQPATVLPDLLTNQTVICSQSPDEVRRTRLRQDDENKNVLSWTLLIVAGLLEACWAVGLKFTDGFSKPLPSLIVGSAIVASMVLLAMALRDLPVGTAYAIWVSIGILGAAISQPLIFNEPLRPIQIFFLLLLVASVAGLKMTTK